MNPLHLEPGSMDRLLPGESGVAAADRPIHAGNGGQPFLRLELLRSLQLHRKLALGIAVAGAVLAAAYWFLTGPVYVAQSIVYIQPAPQRVMAQGPSWPYAQQWPYDANTYESYIQQQIENVKRPDVLAAAVKKLESGGAWLHSGESDQAAVGRLGQSISVTREGTSYQFAIAARASDGTAAADAANAVAASFIESASHQQKAGDQQRLAVLGEERTRVQNALASDRAEQDTLNKQLGVAAIGTGTPDVYDEDIGRIRGELITARASYDEAAARLTSMNASEGASSAALDSEADEIVATDAGLMSMKTSLNQRRAILISQMANLTPNHPEYRQDAEELAQINNTLESMTRDLRAKAASRLEEKMHTDLERTAGVEARLNGQLNQLTQAAGNATSKLQRSNELAVDIARLQNRFTTVDEEWRNLMLEEGGPGSAFLSASASAPLHPVRSGQIRTAAMLLFGGLLLGMMAAVTAHKMDPRVYIASDVEHVLGYAPMALLPDFIEVPEGVAEEHLLRLAAAIEYARKQGNLRSCIFTGTGPGTGVTTVVGRMRDLLEAMGRTTVLVDASGAAAAASRGSSVPAAQPENQALVASQRGSRSSALLQQMAEETRTRDESLVLTDTAPIAISAETEYLARFVDCAIVVIESGVTTREELRETASTLQRVDVAAVGFVLNRVGLEKADRAFRLSVAAVENHLRAQGGSASRRAARGIAPAPESALAEEHNPLPPALPARHEPIPAVPLAAVRAPVQAVAEPAVKAVVPYSPPAPVIPESAIKAVARLSPPAPIAPESAIKAVARPSPPAVPEPAVKAAPPVASPVAPERSPLPANPARVTPRLSTAPPAQESTQPMNNKNSDLPWWLADLYPQPEEPRRAAPPEPGNASGPQPDALGPQAVVPAPKPRPAPRLQSWDRLPGEYDKARPPAPPSPSAESPLGWKSRVPASAAQDSFAEWKAGARPEEAAEEDEEESSPNLASRLTGLRNLLTVLGKKGQQEFERPPERPAEAVRQLNPVLDSPPVARVIAPAPAMAAAGRVSAPSPRLVTAVPEFLPPKEPVEIRDSAYESTSRSRHDRLETYDDLQILPSRRGQYKRR